MNNSQVQQYANNVQILQFLIFSNFMGILNIP